MPQNGSILDETRKALGVGAGDDVFDTELIMHINGAFADLWSQGIGPEGGFEIHDSEELWSDFTGGDPAFNQIGTLIYLQVKLVFDVFAEGMTSYVIQMFERRIDRIKFQMQAEVEHRIALARLQMEAGLVAVLGYDPKTNRVYLKPLESKGL